MLDLSGIWGLFAPADDEGSISDRLGEVCGEQPSAACQAVLRWTDNQTLAGLADVLVQKPLTIALILLVAVVARLLLNRAVARLVQRTVAGPLEGSRPARGSGRGSKGLREVPPLEGARRKQRAETVGSVLRSFVTFIVFGTAAVMVLGELGVNLAPIIASAGVVGIAVGFGAQNLVRDVITGISMILEDQYGVGDVIDAGDATGAVEAVGLRTTRLRDVNGVVWHIRNGEILRVGNMSQGWSRAVLDVPVSYGNEVERAKEVIKRQADDLWQDPEWDGLVLEEPEMWGVENLAADGVVLRLVVKTRPLEQWKVARALRERIKNAFDAESIEIPFPQRAVWVRGEGPGSDEAAAGGA